ncbi:MAG: hypothetical protein JWN33_27 [Candidatus Saccharibacteria bacterium]|nr:hypothetical protein [Candidatus Saccharibacteria bacterium]
MGRSAAVGATVAYVQPVLVYSGETACATGSTFDGTAVMVTAGTTLYDYADGNSANWIWNGTANNSSSTGPSS